MRLLVNHQLIPIQIQPKSFSLGQICDLRSQCIAVTLLYGRPFFGVKKQRPINESRKVLPM